ncbi:hypothetical protein [Marvinbryantia formatexigens]|uniref:hypothetical protein n=1 Tax=Marvinbryantia formatexigens TaxID=168384 RepID=UPI00059282D2|nr:hypothetical protein [Marvinbryantia formatexigens]
MIIVCCIFLMLLAGFFIYYSLGTDRGQEPDSENIGTLGNVYEQIQANQGKAAFDEDSLTMEDLEALIVEAESIELNGYEQSDVEKLKQRIEEAQNVTDNPESDADINTIGVAYMNLSIAIDALTQEQ